MFVGVMQGTMGFITWVVLAELFPLKFRGLSMGISVFFMWIMNAVVSYLFPLLQAKLGLGPVFLIFVRVGLAAMFLLFVSLSHIGVAAIFAYLWHTQRPLRSLLYWSASELAIAAVSRLTPHMIRVTLRGEELADFASAAADVGIEARILHRLSAAPDHPVGLAVPEGEYLKGLACQV